MFRIFRWNSPRRRPAGGRPRRASDRQLSGLARCECVIPANIIFIRYFLAETPKELSYFVLIETWS